tara:strand:+ start:104 stop:526 length:423 start_codon:yes stop_codon:yes gene_type:complete
MDIINDLKEFIESIYYRFVRLSDLNKFVVLFGLVTVFYVVFVYYKRVVENMETEGGVLRFFYANWCPHCRDAKPEWDSLVKRYKGNVKLVKVDCTSDTKVAQKYGVEGFPTILLTKNGKNIEYEGERVAEDIMEFLKNHS